MSVKLPAFVPPSAGQERAGAGSERRRRGPVPRPDRTVTITLRLPEELLARLDHEAERLRVEDPSVTRQTVMREALAARLGEAKDASAWGVGPSAVPVGDRTRSTLAEPAPKEGEGRRTGGRGEASA